MLFRRVLFNFHVFMNFQFPLVIDFLFCTIVVREDTWYNFSLLKFSNTCLFSGLSYGLEKEMATYSSIFAWRILWTEEPGGLLSMALHRVGHDWSDLACVNALEKEMATHSSTLAWRIPGTEEPGGLLSTGSQSRTWLKQLSSSSIQKRSSWPR